MGGGELNHSWGMGKGGEGGKGKGQRKGSGKRDNNNVYDKVYENIRKVLIQIVYYTILYIMNHNGLKK